MAVVAVLLIHIDRTAVTPNSIKTATDIRPLAIRSTLSAMALSNSCLCNAAARAKPPRNKKMIGLAKLLSACGVLNIQMRQHDRNKYCGNTHVNSFG